MEFNTCEVLTRDVRALAYYTHLVPIASAILLSGYLYIRTKHNLYSRVFAVFVFGFVLWLVSDLVAWTVPNYYLVTAFWSLFDYANILFYLYGLYFVVVVLLQKDIPVSWKWFGFALTVPAMVTVISGNAIVLFDHAVCEAWGNVGLDGYQNYIESFVMLGVLITIGVSLFHKNFRQVRAQVFVIGSALLLFFGTFSTTDYISVTTGVYEVGLYGLLIMPIFLGLIVYSTVTFHTFRANIFGAQMLVASLLVVIASEFLFVETLINRVLVAITFVLALLFGATLVRSVRREVVQRQEIEKLAHELELTNDRQETLIHFIGHEVKGFLTKDAGAFAALSEGDLGPLPETAKPFVASALQQSRAGADSVANILKASNLKKGTVSYDKKPFDMKELVTSAVERAKQMAADKKLELTLQVAEGSYQMVGDGPQINDHVLRNLIENALNYTPAGSVVVSLKNDGGKVIFSVKDSGVGITDEDKKRLFTEGGHGAESQKVNAHSTGYGLYIAKQIVDAHGGSIRAESEGAGKGSTFIAEFPVGA